MRANWKWFFEAPLSAAWRSRLELCLGVVLSGAAVVALAAMIPPDPAKVAALRGTIALASSAPAPRTVETTPDEPKPPPSDELVRAIRAGDVAAIRKAYEPGTRMQGMLALAARSGRKEAVLWVLAHGASIHDEEYSPDSPILSADATPEIAALLRQRGAREPSLEDAAGANAPNAFLLSLATNPKADLARPLTAASSSSVGTAANKRLIVSKLLDAGADPNASFADSSALGGAVEGCDARGRDESLANECMTIVRLLLDHGAHVTGDALGAALSLDDGRRAAPLDALLDLPLERGVTAVALARATAIQPGDLERVVARGIDWAWHDGEEDAALPVLAAVRRGDRNFVRALLDAGAPVDVHFKDGSCALTEAIDGAANNADHARIVELLVTRGANVNRRLPDGRTPLFAAAESGDIRVVNFLLAHGARVNDLVLDDTALDAAEQHGNTPAARVLHAHGGRRARLSLP